LYTRFLRLLNYTMYTDGAFPSQVADADVCFGIRLDFFKPLLHYWLEFLTECTDIDILSRGSYDQIDLSKTLELVLFWPGYQVKCSDQTTLMGLSRNNSPRAERTSAAGPLSVMLQAEICLERLGLALAKNSFVNCAVICGF
jgi:hypothetical protein